MKSLGIDPGAVSGGCAIVLINDGTAPQLVDAIDLPVIGIKAKTAHRYLGAAQLDSAAQARLRRDRARASHATPRRLEWLQIRSRLRRP
jgi:hypothetical protein